jgi:hypothetical protein
MTKSAFIGALALGLACVGSTIGRPAVAQEAQPPSPSDPSAERVALATHIVEMTATDEEMETMMAVMRPALRASPLAREPGRDPDHVGAVYEEEVSMQFRAIKTEIAQLYAATFTEAELREILAFYQSPTGARLIEQQPAILEEIARLGADVARRALEALQKRLDYEDQFLTP